ncbi:DUF1934 domain-containing protein [Ureibacillus chungkukjangi]|uniref:DUF1934 domain-containing protein n=1 Tax=Ureibacillus chungkukjangi TaxID=1202712 RepID=UPI00203B4589|nr:DUF1934 domain-containing protein [Ureibacillus chungkukjangi]MCM3389543.1 DUF1934 domain-containing protein [Ureibacillus chungkukjangi]
MSMEETKVKIKLNSTILPIDGEKENYEMWLDGALVKKSGKSYLRYVEQLEEKEIRTTVKMGNEDAFILRGGGVKMRLPFNTIKEEIGEYETQFGSMPIITKTKHLSYDYNEDNQLSGKFNVQYDLIISGQSVGKYTLEIQYSEVQK